MLPEEIDLWLEASLKAVVFETLWNNKKVWIKKNEEDKCIYAKFKNGKFIFLILYVDDILLASSDVDLLLETKKFLSSKFDMKDLGEASFVLGIEIHRDRRNGVLALSQKAYLEKI